MSTVIPTTTTGELSTRKGFRAIINVVLAAGLGTTNVIPTDPFNHTPEQISAQVLDDTTGTALAGTPVVTVPVATSLPIATIPVVVSGAGASAATARVSVTVVARE